MPLKPSLGRALHAKNVAAAGSCLDEGLHVAMDVGAYCSWRLRLGVSHATSCMQA